jgi:hypothetical protein
MSTEKTNNETVVVKGDDLLAKVKEIVHQGNVRRIIISNEEGQRLIEVPLTVGVVGALLLPAWAAVGAIAAVVANAKIEIERVAE